MQLFRSTRRALALALISPILAAGLATSVLAAEKPAGIGASFKGPLGLQMYSLRFYSPTNNDAKLDKARELGFNALESNPPSGTSAEAYRAAANARGLKLIGSGADYNQLKSNADAVVEQAKKLGVKYVMCAGIPHERSGFTEKNARDAAEVFNNAGAKFRAAGITFAYHCHGFEFQPFGNGTLFDLLVKETKPEFVSFEMDVFWAAHGGADPAKLLEKHGSRFKLMHVKDLKKGTPKNLSGGAPDEASVAIGEGEIDWPAVLKAAQRASVEYYFIEDESKEVLDQIPRSLRYLENVRW